MMEKKLDWEKNLTIELGVKSDPIQYRYSFDWLFNLMAEEGVYNLQLGTFTEFYSLPDTYFYRLKNLLNQRFRFPVFLPPIGNWGVF